MSARTTTVKVSHDELESLKQAKQAMFGERFHEDIPHGVAIQELCDSKMRRLIRMANESE